MFKKRYLKIYNYLMRLFSKQDDNQEFIDQCISMKEVLKITNNRIITEKDYYMNISNIRFESLQSGHNLGKLTSDEERELENMLTVNMLNLCPWKRERVGMRACYFID